MSNKSIQLNDIMQNYQKQINVLTEKLNVEIKELYANRDDLQIKNRKYGLLIGIDYIGTRDRLEGCINDVKHIKNQIITKYGFSEEDIIVLTDNTVIKPTKAIILEYFKKLLTNAVAGDTLFFHFSGHGSSVVDRNGDENDYYDEFIISEDLEEITDDEFNKLINTHMKQGVSLFALFDSCHSGTMLDLKYQYLDSTNYNKVTVNTSYLETKGNVFMISGCTDSQKSKDAFINGITQGAMTWSFLETVNKKSDLSWNDLIINMRTLIKDKNYKQIPQFSCGKETDLASKFIFANVKKD